MLVSRLHARYPGLDLQRVPLGSGPSPVRFLPGDLTGRDDVWLKDESRYGGPLWGGNKVRKMEWIIPEAHRRRRDVLFTVGGIGTHWGLVAARYGADHGLRTVLGLVDQPVDDHVRDQLARLQESGAEIHRFSTPRALRIGTPLLLARHPRRTWYLPAGGSNPVGTLGYVEAALEIAEQVHSGELPEPATVVTAVGSGGTAAGLALGLHLAGLGSRVVGAVVNDSLRLDVRAITGLADRTAGLLRSRGAYLGELRPLLPQLRTHWLGRTYGDPTPASVRAVGDAAAHGLELEPVYTGKALAALRDLGTTLPGPVLWLNTHGPR